MKGERDEGGGIVVECEGEKEGMEIMSMWMNESEKEILCGG